MYNQSKNWAKGNGKMYVFDIKESFENVNKPQQLSLFDNSQELWNENKDLLESNGMNEESFNQMYNEFGEDFIRDYIKKCKS